MSVVDLILPEIVCLAFIKLRSVNGRVNVCVPRFESPDFSSLQHICSSQVPKLTDFRG